MIFDLIQQIPSWVLDFTGTLLTMIGLYFYVFNNKTAWHWSNLGLVPYTLLFASLGLWPLFFLYVCFILFGLHGYVLWFLQDKLSPHVGWWQFLTTPIAAILMVGAYLTTTFTDFWAAMQFTIVAFSIVASWALARRFAWSWIVWLPANVLGLVYYYHENLWFLMVAQIPLFAFSVYGYWEWTRGGVAEKGIIPKPQPAVAEPVGNSKGFTTG